MLPQCIGKGTTKDFPQEGSMEVSNSISLPPTRWCDVAIFNILHASKSRPIVPLRCHVGQSIFICQCLLSFQRKPPSLTQPPVTVLSPSSITMMVGIRATIVRLRFCLGQSYWRQQWLWWTRRRWQLLGHGWRLWMRWRLWRQEQGRGGQQ